MNTEIAKTQTSTLITDVAQSNYKTAKVSPLGSFEYKFNGKGVNDDAEATIFLVDGFHLKDNKGDLKESVEFSPVAMKLISCKDFFLFNDQFDKIEMWLEFIFLDFENKMSSLFLKGERMDSFIKAIKAVSVDGKLTNKRFSMTREKKKSSTHNTTYYVLKFEVVGDNEKALQKDIDELLKDANILESMFRFPYKVARYSRTDGTKL